MNPTRKPELVSPAGDREALRAAVANGADSVYFGLPRFNARQRATNFTLEELPEIIGYLHDHNVHGYVTFNTLLFSEELPQAVELLTAIAEAGADAVVVQDLGLLRLVRRLAPDLRVHASTQMTLTEPRGINLVRALGVQRVILARELSLAEIERSAGETEAELEVFVHGALCISYSGQCLASESLGGRSANRGLCAQPCRLGCRLLDNGRPVELGDRQYLLSPQDLALHDRIDRLVALGVAGFKIEGRLKSAQYVAIATKVYRDAIDAALRRRPFQAPADAKQALSQSFSRGFTHGYLDGEAHPRIVDGRSPRNRGVRVGQVVEAQAGRVIVAPDQAQAADPLKPGDGVLFDPGRPERDEQGGRIYSVETVPGRGREARLALTFREGDVNLAAVEPGAILWKTDDPALRKRLEQTYARDVVARRVPLSAVVRAAFGEPLRITWSDDAGRRADVVWDRPLEQARQHPITLDLIREQLGRLGDTPFELTDLRAERLDPVMVPKSVLNDLRRQAVDTLLQARRRGARRRIDQPDALEKLRGESAARFPSPDVAATRLHVLVRTMEQLDAALAWARDLPEIAGALYGDFREARMLQDALQRARPAGVSLGAAALRILKPGEEGFLRPILDARPDVVLVRNLATLQWFKQHAPEMPLIGDFSLNAANDLSVALMTDWGFRRLVPSFDLTWPQLAAMLRHAPAGAFEVVIHQHMPTFHTQHCLLHANLGAPGAARCPGHCRGRRFELQDHIGAAHPLLTDAACRTTLFNARPQSACEVIPEMRRAGLRHFRLDLLRETAAETHELLRLYSRLLAGTLDTRAAWHTLRDLTAGALIRGAHT